MQMENETIACTNEENPASRVMNEPSSMAATPMQSGTQSVMTCPLALAAS